MLARREYKGEILKSNRLTTILKGTRRIFVKLKIGKNVNEVKAIGIEENVKNIEKRKTHVKTNSR